MTIEPDDPLAAHNSPSADLHPIGKVAKLVGLTARAIRYYEELGLLTPEVRVKGVPRLFTADDIQRLREIKRLREIAGFSLAELSELLDNEDLRAQLRERFQNTSRRADRVALMRDAIELASRRLAIIERKLSQLQGVRTAEIEHIALIRSLLENQERDEEQETPDHNAADE
jgi:MerR family transcriptional regulator, repressor of the yfmOP operon